MPPLPKWYKKKSYPHFDRPLSFDEALVLVSNPQKIKEHSFLPFISFQLKQRRFGKEPKSRPIKYASHRDGYIFSYYASLLENLYETALVNRNISEAVLAYRSGIGNNITFAKEAFEKIHQLGNCAAIGLDISGFFDNLDHHIIKNLWAELLGGKKLPDDHYAVFKAITKYSYVDKDKCYERLGYSRQVAKIKRPICDAKTFRAIIRGDKNTKSLIETNLSPFGIPQGSSISALLANVCMLMFDEEMSQIANEIGGIYRRYSDDILLVCLPDHEDDIKKRVESCLKKAGEHLTIQKEKTLVSHFFRKDNEVVLKEGDQPFQYLGFTYDGKRQLMRPQTLSRFWRKAIFSIRKAKIDAQKARRKNRNPVVFKRKIYKRFTHLGNSNFLTYAKRASITLSDKNCWKNQPAWKQINQHWERINKEINLK
jgi:hypothetical protein